MPHSPSATSTPKLVDVYPYRVTPSGIEFLMMLRAKNRLYEGQWRMVGGKIKTNETAAEAAVREFTEETGLRAELFWCVPSVNSFFDFERNILHHIPVFACCCGPEAEPVLNHEHQRSGWFSPTKAATLTPWPEQQRLITLIGYILHTQASLPPEWILAKQTYDGMVSQTDTSI